MLKESLKGKTIAVLGSSTVTAKVVFKRLLSLCENKIIALQIAKDPSRKQKFLEDPYFNQQQRKQIEVQVDFVALRELERYTEEQGRNKIDILLNLYEPVDFSNPQKMVEYHLVTTSSIIKVFSRIKVGKCILLSSVYVKDPGYISEDEDFEDATIPTRFDSREQASQYLKNNFTEAIEAWKWTLGYIERSYLSVCQQMMVVRVPSLGPTIIGHQGYCPQLNNFSYLIRQVGLGNIRSLDGIKNIKIDVIPADYVSNLFVVLSGKEMSMKADIINLSTTTRNYITLQQFIDFNRQAWREYGEKPAKVRIVQTELGQKLKHMSERLPSEVKKRLGSMLDMVSWKIDGQRESRESEQKIGIIGKYKYFLCKEWLCESIKTIDLFNHLSPEEQLDFDFNVNHINWKVYAKLCVFAIKKHILNQHVEQFKPHSLDMLGSNRQESYFSDIMWALKMGKETPGQPRYEAVQFVLNSKSVKQAIRSIVEDNMLKLQNPPTSYEKAEEELTKVAEEICVTMFSDYSMKSIRMFGWFLHKLFSTIYEKVVVDKGDIAKIQNHSQSKGPLIIIPTHRSYVDFLIISYIFFGYGIKCPHIAAAEDFLGMAVVHILLRRSGAFFIKRNQKKHKELYKAILNEYLSKLMIGNHFIQFFIEGTRSRTGKMLAPKFGILSAVAQNVVEGRVADAFVLPVTINYEKILEGNSFTYEMMGEAKVKESLSRVLKAADIVKENFGRIHIQFCEMISIKNWLATSQGAFQQQMSSLGIKIVNDLTKKLVISGPAIVSSVVLMNRKGISDDSLQEQTTWLSKEVSSRGFKITRSQPDSSISVSSTLGLLEGIVSKSKKDMFQVEVSFDQKSFVKLFTLTYNRNTLTHIFFKEAIVATALASFGYKIISGEGVALEQLYQRTIFLWNLFENEFYMTESLQEKKEFTRVIDFMMGKNLLKFQKQKLVGMNLQGNYYNFYWSLIWPIADSYWITCLYLFKLIKSTFSIPISKLVSEIQWFAQSLINDRVSSFLEAISSDTIKNSVNVFLKTKLLVGVKQLVGGEQISAVKLGVGEEEIKKMLQQIEPYLKGSYGKSLKGVLDSKHGLVNLDFPFLSRL